LKVFTARRVGGGWRGGTGDDGRISVTASRRHLIVKAQSDGRSVGELMFRIVDSAEQTRFSIWQTASRHHRKTKRCRYWTDRDLLAAAARSFYWPATFQPNDWPERRIANHQ
jgi:hypothetical protein